MLILKGVLCFVLCFVAFSVLWHLDQLFVKAQWIKYMRKHRKDNQNYINSLEHHRYE